MRVGEIGRTTAIVLKVLVRGFHLLFKGTHEAVPRLEVGLDLWVLDLEQQTALTRDRVTLLEDLQRGSRKN